MRLSFAFAIPILLAAALPQDRVMAADTLRVGGTGTASGMLQQVGAAFGAASGIKVVVISSLGSSGAIRALAERRLDIAVSARPLRAAEAAASLIQVGSLRTSYVIATSHRNPNGFKSTDLADIYKSPSAAWADGTPIRIILRPRSDTDTELLGDLFPGMRDAIESARLRQEVPTAATDQDNADLAERMTGSLTGTTATQIKTEGRHLQAVPIDGVEPTVANFESGAYRFAKKLYFIVRADGDPDAARFMTFLRSSEGLKLLRGAEVLPGAE